MTLFIFALVCCAALMVGGALIYRNNAARPDAAIKAVESVGKTVVDDVKKV